MTETPVTAPVFPPGRYGRRRSGKPTSRLLIGVLAVIMLAMTGWIGVRLYQAYGDTDYSSAVTRFSLADREVSVEFIVRIPAGASASCIVRARNAAGVEVGRDMIVVDAGVDPARTVATHRLVTSDRPVTGEVEGCVPAGSGATLR
ncbi:hypothetical protein F4553_003721 [Allocatelliglobosispora scoriae]|uniref:DUF4307 domain-containing protein n=1 Tax=Allocatelliglobosispora scoriae TaxID=643052 RepID=A0A841BUC1_9ACTN|nr:DUF4307 domain-containing protein [Allocatelliglobosispora scoriae]MBB5870342.1 hypothetical protein [Allocatelliglobosispora scoriae]